MNEAPQSEPTIQPEAQPVTPAPQADAPKTNLGEKFSKDAAWQRAMAAVAKMGGESTPPPAGDEPAATDAEPAKAEPEKPAAPPAKELESDKWVEARRARARAEREAAERARAAEEAERSYKAKAEALTPFEKAQELIKAGRKLEAARVLGIDYADLTVEMVNGPKPEDPTEPLKKELEELKAWREEQARAAKEAEARDMELAAVRLVREDTEKLEDIALLRKHDGWEHEVVQLMKLRWEQIGWRGDVPPITPEQAARELNAALKEQRRAELRAVADADPELLRELGFVRAETQNTIAPEAARAQASETPRLAPRTLSSAHEGEAGRLTEAVDHAELRRRAILRAQQVLPAAEK